MDPIGDKREKIPLVFNRKYPSTHSFNLDFPAIVIRYFGGGGNGYIIFVEKY